MSQKIKSPKSSNNNNSTTTSNNNNNKNNNLNNKNNTLITGKKNSYILSTTIGKGTFGKVKLTYNASNSSELYACKILEKANIKDKDDAIRCEREMNIIKNLQHINCVKTYEIISSNTNYYIIMDYCSKGELFNYIVKHHHLSNDISAFFYYQIINGIEYIHSKGVCHRDLKPENLLLKNNLIIKIIDFGLSNYFSDNVATNNNNLLITPCGSPCYASPEMVMGKKYNGFKIDIWSSGIILYAMLCGYLPFEEGEVDDGNERLFKNIVSCNVEYPKEFIGNAARDLLMKILVRDPKKRINIEDIKKHKFYLRGKKIFENRFNINPEKDISNRQNNNNNNNKNESDNNNNNNNDNLIEKKHIYIKTEENNLNTHLRYNSNNASNKDNFMNNFNNNNLVKNHQINNKKFINNNLIIKEILKRIRNDIPENIKKRQNYQKNNYYINTQFNKNSHRYNISNNLDNFNINFNNNMNHNIRLNSISPIHSNILSETENRNNMVILNNYNITTNNNINNNNNLLNSNPQHYPKYQNKSRPKTSNNNNNNNNNYNRNDFISNRTNFIFRERFRNKISNLDFNLMSNNFRANNNLNINNNNNNDNNNNKNKKNQKQQTNSMNSTSKQASTDPNNNIIINVNMIKPKIILDEKINNNSNKNSSNSKNNNTSDNKRLSDRYNNFVALTTNYRKNNNIKNYNIIRPITEVYNNNILNKFNIKHNANHNLNHKIKPDINKVIMNIKEQIKKLNHNITKIKH